jgi:ketosteroid isomerase-like protein
MIAFLLVAAAVPTTAIEAERAFAADAQKVGQWTAFRKWSADDAMMFVPQPVKAQEFLKGKADPPVAVFWWPGRSYVSCDGNTAINTGPWVREWGKSVGYFTTVWRRQPGGGWKWTYDGGDTLDAPRAEGGDIEEVRALCGGQPPPAPNPELDQGVKFTSGESADGTLRWTWSVVPHGSRSFRAWLWTLEGMQRVIDDQVAAPPK